MANACANCNRPTCALLTLPKPPYGAEADDWNAAVADCRAHTVDWRAETMRLRDTIAQVRAHEFNAPHGRDCLAHVHVGKYCNCGVTLWQEGYDAALEAVAGILGEVAK